MNMIAKAIDLASSAHLGQFRRDGVTPYIEHPARVAKRLIGDEEAQAVAWLHDVLEDTDLTKQDLRQAGLPETVIEAVTALTKQKGHSEHYDDYLARVGDNPLAANVKIQDMLDNLADTPTERQKERYIKGIRFLLDLKSKRGQE